MSASEQDRGQRVREGFESWDGGVVEGELAEMYDQWKAEREGHAVALEQARRETIEQFREKAFEPFSALEYISRMRLWQHLQDTATSLSSAPETGNRRRAAPGVVEATEELLAAHEAYEKLLIDELTDFAGIAFAHGFRSTRVEAGKQARERIAAALAALRAAEGGPK